MEKGYIHRLIQELHDRQREYHAQITACFKKEFSDFDEVVYYGNNNLSLKKAGKSRIGFYVYATYATSPIDKGGVRKIHVKTPDWKQDEINAIKQRIADAVNRREP